MLKRVVPCIISLILVLSLPICANAATIDELKKQKEETQKQLNETNENISELTERKKGITDEIDALDDELVEVMTSVSILEDEIEDIKVRITDKQAEVTAATEELHQAEATELAQYEAMKKRIRYMYERGDYSYIEMLFEAKSLADMLNKTEYFEKLYEYDRKMLIRYQEARQAVEDAKARLEEEEEELKQQQEELEISLIELDEEKQALNELLDQKKEEAENYETEISRAKQEAAAYKAKIKQQNNEIKRLEAEEAAKKAAAEAAKNKNSTKKTGSAYSVDSASVIANSGGSASGKEIASYACQYVGNPYVAGGTSLTSGCDCSGFTYAVYQAFGYSIPRNSTGQRNAGRGVTYAEAQPGDIICYAGHVALYIGNGQIVHASTPSTGIKYGYATYKEILAVRRIVD